MYFTDEVRNLIYYLPHSLLPSMKSKLKHGGQIQKNKKHYERTVTSKDNERTAL